jgi:hypothetical protein
MHAVNGNAVVFLEFFITIVIFPYINSVVHNSLAEICTVLTCMMSAKCTAFNDNYVSETCFCLYSECQIC